MSINIKVALAGNVHVDTGVLGQSREHVVEETDACIDVVDSLSVKIDPDLDVSLFCGSSDLSCSRHF